MTQNASFPLGLDAPAPFTIDVKPSRCSSVGYLWTPFATRCCV